MSRTNSNQKLAATAAGAQDRAREAAIIAAERARGAAAKVKPTAAQVKPLAKSTQDAARRGMLKGRAWAAPRIEHTGQVLQDNVAPKVADALSAAARRIEPDKPDNRRWWTLSGIAVLLAAAASAAAAGLRRRSGAGSQTPAAEDDTGETAPAATQPDTSNADAGHPS